MINKSKSSLGVNDAQCLLGVTPSKEESESKLSNNKGNKLKSNKKKDKTKDKPKKLKQGNKQLKSNKNSKAENTQIENNIAQTENTPNKPNKLNKKPKEKKKFSFFKRRKVEEDKDVNIKTSTGKLNKKNIKKKIDEEKEKEYENDEDYENDEELLDDEDKHKLGKKPKLNKKSDKGDLKRMYKELLLYNLNSGTNLHRESDLTGGHIQLEVDRLYTKEYEHCALVIMELPETVPFNYLALLKNECIRDFRDCKMKIHIKGMPYAVNFFHKETKMTINNWQNRYNRMQMEIKNPTLANKVTNDISNKKRYKIITKMIKSITKLSEVQTQGYPIYKSYIFLDLYSKDETRLFAFKYHVQKKLMDMGVETKYIKNFNEFMESYSVASKRKSKLLSKEINDTILTSIDLACITPYTQGTNGFNGVYAGTDIETGNPLWISFTASAKAQNVGIFAKAGEGKSTFVKTILKFHHLFKHNIVLMDYNGKEYDNECRIMNGLTISQRAGNSKYVNTFKVGDISGLTFEEAKERLIECMGATERTFMIIYGVNKYQDESADTLFNDICKDLFTDKGIDMNIKETYSRTEFLDIKEIYTKLVQYKSQTAMKERHGETLNNAIKRCEPYFHEKGFKRYMFENEITLDDIKHSKFIRFDFGMDSNSDEIEGSKDFLLRLNTMGFLTTKYLWYKRYVLNEYTAVAYEEVQRAMSEKMILRIINHVYTGGRKLNVIGYIIANSANFLSSEDLDAQAIKDNLTTKIIGFLEPEARKKAVSVFELETYKSQIDLVSNSTDLKNSFFIRYDNGVERDAGIYRMNIPNELRGSISTRDIQII